MALRTAVTVRNGMRGHHGRPSSGEMGLTAPRAGAMHDHHAEQQHGKPERTKWNR